MRFFYLPRRATLIGDFLKEFNTARKYTSFFYQTVLFENVRLPYNLLLFNKKSSPDLVCPSFKKIDFCAICMLSTFKMENSSPLCKVSRKTIAFSHWEFWRPTWPWKDINLFFFPLWPFFCPKHYIVLEQLLNFIVFQVDFNRLLNSNEWCCSIIG